MKPWHEYQSKVPYPKVKSSTYSEELQKYREGERAGEQEFFNDARKSLGYSDLLTERGCRLLENKAWDDGHANGFSEVYIHLQDLVELAKELQEEYKKTPCD